MRVFGVQPLLTPDTLVRALADGLNADKLVGLELPAARLAPGSGVTPQEEMKMRTLSVFALAAAFAVAPFAAGEDKKKPERPPLDSKEWKKTDSGLEIWDVKVGKGDAVKPGATVVIHYTGWLTDEKATKFDSSVDRGKKAEFPLDKLIKGWQEGIPGMKPGGVRRLKIPAALAYGDADKGGIPANSVLVFEIELFEGK